MPIYLRSIGAYAPEKRVSNDDLAKTIDTSDEWIRSHTGIGARHIAADSESTSDLAAKAALKAIEAAGLTKDDITYFSLSSATQDYGSFPSTACVAQGKLGLKNAFAFDISAACSGFIYGLALAESYVLQHGGNAIVAAGEVLSRTVDWTDRATCVLFGDGAGAAVVSATKGPEGQNHEILDSIVKSYGENYDALYLGNVGFRPEVINAPEMKKPRMTMDGHRVYNFAVNENVTLIQALVEKAGLTLADIKWIVPHQANSRIIQAAAKRLGLQENRFFVNIQEYANTSACSIPLALADMEKQNLLKAGDKIILVGFGAGLTSGAMLIQW
jgi:3-oxoacyl-[acyl-carrier-protein] synthase-3